MPPAAVTTTPRSGDLQPCGSGALAVLTRGNPLPRHAGQKCFSITPGVQDKMVAAFVRCRDDTGHEGGTYATLKPADRMQVQGVGMFGSLQQITTHNCHHGTMVIGRYDVKKDVLHRDAYIRPSLVKRHGNGRLFNRTTRLRKMAVKRVLAPATSITRILSTSTKARAAAHRASLSVSDKTLEGDCCVGYSYTAGTLIEDIRPCGEQAYSTSIAGTAPYSTPSGMRGTTPRSTQALLHGHLLDASQ